jgi:membrane-bound metal-dependent hydrolase YbcI (DUF457 family)
MNGRTHALIGCSIVPVTALGSGMSVSECAVLTAVSAGFSLGPDIDHPNSTITRALGTPVHHLFHGLATAALSVLSSGSDLRARTRAADQGIDPSHRGLTHTLIFTVAVAGAVYGIGHSDMATAVMAAACVAVCRKLVPGRWQMSLIGAALAMLAFGAYVSTTPQQVALAAGAGWLSHVIADSCTTAGVPVLWPLKIKGRRWWRLRLLGGWLKSGERKESWAALGVTTVMNLVPYLILT